MASPKTLTTEETEKLLNELLGHYIQAQPKPKQIRNYTICLLMLDAGLRVGEVVQLQISDLYFNSLPVTSIIIRPEIAKNKTERIIPVSQRLSDALKKVNEYMWDERDRLGHTDPRYSGLLAWVLTTRQVERIIRAAAMKSLGRPVHPHVLRHTFASRIMRTTNMRTVQELLGHKNLSSTQIYTHPNHEDLTKAINSMDNNPPIGESNTTQNVPLPDVSNRPDTPGTDRDMG